MSNLRELRPVIGRSKPEPKLFCEWCGRRTVLKREALGDSIELSMVCPRYGGFLWAFFNTNHTFQSLGSDESAATFNAFTGEPL